MNVTLAIFKRNLKSYFSSPIGYVFICAFVLLCAFAAFWPNEFFTANLANLDQLNKALPWIMLVIIPAITMSVWADERRQGTDELLLTLPADDFQVVLGKYLSCLAIYAAALLFSFFNIFVLSQLGEPDVGLIVANYVGYFIVGAGMLALGMVASFLTSNLTVSFILAAALNAPLVFAQYADAILPRDWAIVVKSFSVAEQFRDFGRGVISLQSIIFFASLATVSLYVCMILISRRHWAGRRAGLPMQMHHVLRVVALLVIAMGVNVAAAKYDARVDASFEQINSLSPRTTALLDKLENERPVIIEAFISPEVPESYVQTRLNLLNMLEEVRARGGDRVILRINNTEKFSDEAARAQDQFGITARAVESSARGTVKLDQIYLGAAFMCGLDKVVVPFFDRGVPAEYEVIRSIATVSQQERRKIGVVNTDARLFGGLDFQTMGRRPTEQIVEELKKQYEVMQIDARSPIEQKLDALLVVQPSSLPQKQLDNVIAAIRTGIPTAIFEDPFPSIDQDVAPTTQPRVPPGGNNPFLQMNRQPPEPKGNIQTLWSLLQVQFGDREIVWQNYNPYPKLPEIPRELVFVDEGSGAEKPFSRASRITDMLQQVLFLFPGSIKPAPGATLTFTPLVATSRQTGVVSFDEMIQRNFLGGSLNPQRRFQPTGESYVIAAQITGAAHAPAPPAGATETAENKPINVVLVADIDALYSVFFAIRAGRNDPNQEIDLHLDNVPFVLNTLDVLAGDERFIEIRSRRPVHRTLTAVQQRTEQAQQHATDERDKFIKQFDDKRDEEQQKLQAEIETLKARKDIDPKQLLTEVAIKQKNGDERLQATVERLQRERDVAVDKIERKLAQEIGSVQNTYRWAAITMPIILPLALASIVYVRRHRMERVGVPAARLAGHV
jgi:ABC-2 type transport system permease protein